MKLYGYCRISTRKQNIERQVRNILTVFPDAIIIREIYTGTKFQGRKELEKLLNDRKLLKQMDENVRHARKEMIEVSLDKAVEIMEERMTAL